MRGRARNTSAAGIRQRIACGLALLFSQLRVVADPSFIRFWPSLSGVEVISAGVSSNGGSEVGHRERAARCERQEKFWRWRQHAGDSAAVLPLPLPSDGSLNGEAEIAASSLRKLEGEELADGIRRDHSYSILDPGIPPCLICRGIAHRLFCIRRNRIVVRRVSPTRLGHSYINN